MVASPEAQTTAKESPSLPPVVPVSAPVSDMPKAMAHAYPAGRSSSDTLPLSHTTGRAAEVLEDIPTTWTSELMPNAELTMWTGSSPNAVTFPSSHKTARWTASGEPDHPTL